VCIIYCRCRSRVRILLQDVVVALKRAGGFCMADVSSLRLAAEAVQSAALSLQRVDDVHRGDRLALGVLGVGDRVADDVLEEHLQDAASLLVDQTADALHSASTGQTTYSRLGYALDVISQHLAMTLSASFAQSLAAFTASRHYTTISIVLLRKQINRLLEVFAVYIASEARTCRATFPTVFHC
jgi:hypothetical protein